MKENAQFRKGKARRIDFAKFDVWKLVYPAQLSLLLKLYRSRDQLYKRKLYCSYFCIVHLTKLFCHEEQECFDKHYNSCVVQGSL